MRRRAAAFDFCSGISYPCLKRWHRAPIPEKNQVFLPARWVKVGFPSLVNFRSVRQSQNQTEMDRLFIAPTQMEWCARFRIHLPKTWSKHAEVAAVKSLQKRKTEPNLVCQQGWMESQKLILMYSKKSLRTHANGMSNCNVTPELFDNMTPWSIVQLETVKKNACLKTSLVMSMVGGSKESAC